jgi:putative hydrolase of the HAD superfamily
MQLKAVIFDYGGVLCFHPTDDQVNELAALCGAETPDFLNAYWALRRDYDRGDLEPSEYWAHIGQALGRTYGDADIREFRRKDVQLWVRLDNRMMTWAQQLGAFGLRTALLSNLPYDLGEHLRNEMRLPAEFDHHSFSYEIGSVKPDAGIYRHVVAGLGVDPGEALFLDDRPENVEGAKAAGIPTLQYETPSRLKQDLAELARMAGNFVPVGAPPVVLE